MKIGLIFPGQGSQVIGMGKDLYDENKTYRNVVKRVNDLTGLSIENITFNSTDEELNQTKNTQIAILTMSLGVLEILKENGIKADASIGLSLGEYGALINSSAIGFDDGVKIVKVRGELMQNLCPKGDWAMAAILGLEETVINKELIKVTSGFVAAANFNTPGQIVISGERKAIEEASILLKEAGAKKIIELNTSGPFHTKMLKDASDELRKELDKIVINKFETKVFKNLDGKVYTDETNVKDVLAKHIINPVRFEEGIKEMLEMGIDTFVEIGPGKTLSGFVKRINKEVKVLNINSVESLNAALVELKA